MQPSYIIPIIPLVTLPQKRSPEFSYLCDRPLVPGTVVRVPFGPQNVTGVVSERVATSRVPREKLKHVSSIVEHVFVYPRQLSLARYLAGEYFTPLGGVLRLFVPTAARKRENSEKLLSATNSIVLTKEQHEAFQYLRQSDESVFFLHGPTGSGKTEIALSLAKYYARFKKQTLILVPELTAIPSLLERTRNIIDESAIAIVHGKLSTGSFFETWNRIQKCEATIIIGTRAALFAPFTSLEAVIVDEAHDVAHKQWDMAPRYDTRNTAEYLASLYNAKTIFISSIIPVRFLPRIQKKQIARVELPTLTLPHPGARVEIINMRLETWKYKQRRRNAPPPLFSQRLLEILAETLTQEEQSLILVARGGTNRITVCSKCHQPLLCATCSSRMVISENETYRCVRCKSTIDTLASCARCYSLQWRHIGAGTEKIVSTLKSCFPSARIRRADKKSLSSARSQEQLFNDMRHGSIDILVGTQMVSKSWNIPLLRTVAVVLGDDLLSDNTYDSDERALHFLTNAFGRVGQKNNRSQGYRVVQTFQPEHSVFQACEHRTETDFMLEQLEYRRSLHFPPFSRFIILSGTQPNRAKRDKEASQLHKSLCETKIPGFYIYPLNLPNFSSPKGWTTRITIRYEPQEEHCIPSNIKTLLINTVPQTWSVDVDPIRIS